MTRRRSFRSMADINITSLVDVTLTLLIIFMLTAPYIQGGVDVNLPETATRKVVTKEGPVISITSNRQVFWRSRSSVWTAWGRGCSPGSSRRTQCRCTCAATRRCPTAWC